MSWQLTASVDEFLGEAGDFLRAERARNTVLLTVTAAIRATEAAGGPRVGEPGRDGVAGQLSLFGWWRDDQDDAAGGAFLHTPPHPLMLTGMPDQAVVTLAETLAAAGRPVTGINAEDHSAECFAQVWKARTGAGSRVARKMRLFRLGDLAWPEPRPAGMARTATTADRDLLISWLEEFAQEVVEPEMNPVAEADDKVSYGGMTFWEVDGAPVAIAAMTRTVGGMVRVGPVYTPPEHRGHGYAGAATATVSQVALDAGTIDVLLYTDLANPTSNALYQRIGYRPVEDRLVLSFG